MITGIQDFYYSVHNIAKAKTFYTEVLGMKLDFEHDGWIALNLNGVRIGLHPEEAPVPTIPHDAHGPHCGGVLTLKSNNVPADRKLIETGGGKILDEADQPWGHMLVFQDPDGNILKLMNPKY